MDFRWSKSEEIQGVDIVPDDSLISLSFLGQSSVTNCTEEDLKTSSRDIHQDTVGDLQIFNV